MSKTLDENSNWIQRRTLHITTRPCRWCGRVLSACAPIKGKTAFIACVHCDIPCEDMKCPCHNTRAAG